MTEITPTRSAVLELRAERQGMDEGYRFLDEKRLVLAAELLRELARYEQALVEYRAASAEAYRLLQQAAVRHGLEGLQVYPALRARSPMLRGTSRSVLGVLVEEVTLEALWEAPVADFASPEGDACRQAFARLLPLAARLAGLWGNIERLSQEYLKTARRARALEDVLLPEIDRTIVELEVALEDLDREEAVRLRSGRAHRPETA
jgi:V/A-type H+-transporting ATPase subunit D